MNIATFNVNGINGRLPVLLRYVGQPICAQPGVKASDVGRNGVAFWWPDLE
jgi:exonuclease III